MVSKIDIVGKLVFAVIILFIAWIVFSTVEVGINNIRRVDTYNTANFFNVVFAEQGESK